MLTMFWWYDNLDRNECGIGGQLLQCFLESVTLAWAMIILCDRIDTCWTYHRGDGMFLAHSTSIDWIKSVATSYVLLRIPRRTAPHLQIVKATTIAALIHDEDWLL